MDARRGVGFSKVGVFYNDVCFTVKAAAIGHENYQGTCDIGEYKLESKLDFREVRCLGRRG